MRGHVRRRHNSCHNKGTDNHITASFTQLGDVRLTGRWQRAFGADADHASYVGATFGLKLPTGKFDITNGDGEPAGIGRRGAGAAQRGPLDGRGREAVHVVVDLVRDAPCGGAGAVDLVLIQ